MRKHLSNVRFLMTFIGIDNGFNFSDRILRRRNKSKNEEDYIVHFLYVYGWLGCVRMIIYTLILYTCFILYLSLGFYVYHLNRESLTNQSFLVLCLNLSIWAFGYAFMNAAKNDQEAFIWLIISALGWCFFYSSFLYFALMLTQKEGVYKQTWFRASLYFPSLIFFIDTLNYPQDHFKMTSLGLIYQWSSSNLREISYSLYFLGFIAAALFIIFRWGKESDYLQERNQASLIIISTILSLLLGAITDAIFPKFDVSIPPMAIVFMLIATSGIWYAITKYEMMTLTPEVAVDYVLKTIMDPVIFIGNDFLIKRVNRAVTLSTGYEEDELVGQPINHFFQDTSDTTRFQMMAANGFLHNLERNIAIKDNRTFPCVVSGSLVCSNRGEPLGTVCVLHDISDQKKVEITLQQAHAELEQKVRERTCELEKTNIILQKEMAEKERAQEELNHIAYHDALTGLPNRLLLNKSFSEAMLQVQNNNSKLAVVFMDLDNFKLLNDSLGHAIGDLLLQQVAQRITERTRRTDILARISGDEFVLIINNLQDDSDIDIVLDKLMDAFKTPYHLDIHEIFVTASMGVAIYPTDGHDYDTLAKNADIAMYAAKASGRNTWQICSYEMKSRFVEKARLRNRLYRALERDELSVWYQPQIDLKTESIIGFEALMRWQPGHEAFVPPNVFISMAEETGLIVPMGEWILKTACRQVKQWHEAGYRHVQMAINLSSQQLKQKNFVNRVRNILNENDLAPGVLELEITERIVFVGNDDLVQVLRELKEMGIGIAMDDFGVEHSSFMNIKNIPLDKIKIDMHFIQGITANRKDAAIVDAILELANRVGLKVLAEGVETLEQLTYVRNRCCDEVQGYFYYKPMPADEIDEILACLGDRLRLWDHSLESQG